MTKNDPVCTYMMWDAVASFLKPPGASKIAHCSSRKASAQFLSPGAHPGSNLLNFEATFVIRAGDLAFYEATCSFLKLLSPPRKPPWSSRKATAQFSSPGCSATKRPARPGSLLAH